MDNHPKMTAVADATSVTWLLGQLSHDDSVAAQVPGHYQSFARVMNPVGVSRLTWREVAHVNGRDFGPTTAWGAISSAGRFEDEPESGSLDKLTASALVTILAEFTDMSERCLFAFWEGYGDIPFPDNAPTFTFPPDRAMHVFEGPIASAPHSLGGPPSDRLPIRWWPADYSWCVGADIYARSVFVGGSSLCIKALLDCAELEAYEIHPRDVIAA